MVENSKYLNETSSILIKKTALYCSKVRYGIPVTGLRGLEGSGRLRLPDLLTLGT